MTAYTFSQLIDFTRTTSATYVNASGLITTTPASVNLLLYTQEFNSASWALGSGVSVVANDQIAPDGTSTADTITFTTGGGAQYVRAYPTMSVGVVYTVSIYARRVSGTPNFVFDIGNGAAVSGTQTLTGSWQRFSYTFTFSGANQWIDLEASTGGSIAFWGAQLELDSAASTYTKNVGGFFPPRFDYNPVTLAPLGLLVEEQRANFLRYSSEFDNVVWNNASPAIPTITTNTTVAPDGTTTADTLTASTGGTASQSRQNATSTGTTGNFTGSVYLKAGTSTRSRMIVVDTTSGFTVVGDFAIAWSGGVASVQSTTLGTASVTAAGNGWYRCVLTANVPSAGASVAIAVYPDILVGTNSVVAWGAQLEAGSFPTSYIPTVASTVTRTADQANIAAPMFAPWYNQPEGTFVAQFDYSGGTSANNPSGRFVLAASNASPNNLHAIYNRFGVAQSGLTSDGGATQAVPGAGTSLAVNTVANTAYAYKTNDFGFSYNGGAAVVDTSGTVPTNLVILGIGGSGYSTPAFINGHLRSINYYPLRLTNAQLQGLTT
jgi:hypothetical protein